MNNDIRPPQRSNAPRYTRPEARFKNTEYRVPAQPRPPEAPDANSPVPEPILATEPAGHFTTTPQVSLPSPEALPQIVPAAHDMSQHETPVKDEPANVSVVTSPKKPRPILKWVLIVLGLAALVFIAMILWYQQQLQPVSSDKNAISEQLKIESGTTPDQIAAVLHERGLIRSESAFHVYTRLSGTRGQLKAGSYILSPTESMEEIVEHLVAGRMEEFTLTFYPGAALNVSAPTDDTPSHREVLQSVGYEDAEIDAAFRNSYDHPLLESLPEGADIEGYLYGETYQIAAGSSVKEIVTRTFDEFYERLEREGVLATLESKGTDLHDAVILASIVEREVSAGIEDQRQVAQVFFSRLETNMPLGADATFVYAASKMGVAPSVNLDSPYNTRKYGGLPPGPISSPGINAMKAVANPADTDYLFFVSGDDGKNYFSRTIEEHETKTRQYCQKNCSLF